MYPELHLFIDGQWIDASERETRAVFNPATGETLGLLPCATDDDIARATFAAARAFPRWRDCAASERARILQRVSQAIRDDIEKLARTLTLEQGKPLLEARNELLATADAFEWMAQEARRAYGRIVPAQSADTEFLVQLEPVGPVAAFAPWNFPALLPGRKVATALAAGCTIILKPSSETPAIMLALARLCAEAGLPPGALNLLFGDSAKISHALIHDDQIKKISFTGSTEVGRALAKEAGAALKGITLELGGHAPVIVCADVELPKVAQQLIAAKFRNAGQICNCPTRVFVDQRVYEPLLAHLVAETQHVRVGDGLASGTTMGPLINRRRVTAMQDYVRDAIAHKGEVLCGGEPPDDLAHGAAEAAYWSPTIIAGADEQSLLMQEEPFGPIAALQPFTELEEAVHIANSLPYGLAAYGFTQSLSAAKLLQDKLQAGCVSLNTFAVSPSELPYGGVKASGLGREMGKEGLLEHMQTKAVIRRC